MIRSLIFRPVFVVVDIALACLVALAAFMIFQKVAAVQTNEGVERVAEGYEVAFASVGPRNEYDNIVSSGIFGSAAAKNRNFTPPVNEDVEDEAKEETDLPLRLTGWSLSGVGDPKATALIQMANSGQTSKAYYLGQEIIDNVFLLEVRVGEVVLDNRRTGKKEILKRDENYNVNKTALLASKRPGPGTRRNSAANVITLDRADFSKKLMASYEDIATKIDIREYRDKSGKVVGLTSPNITNVELAKELGLQNNDVLTSINNEPIDSIDKVYEVIQKYRNASAFRLGVLRNGKPMFITYRLK